MRGGHQCIEFRLGGGAAAAAQLLPLQRFLHLVRHRRFTRSLCRHDPRTSRWVTMLRIHDALCDGASHRDIGLALFGQDRIERDWTGDSDSLRSRVKRLVRDARIMAQGGYRCLLRRDKS